MPADYPYTDYSGQASWRDPATLNSAWPEPLPVDRAAMEDFMTNRDVHKVRISYIWNQGRVGSSSSTARKAVDGVHATLFQSSLLGTFLLNMLLNGSVP